MSKEDGKSDGTDEDATPPKYDLLGDALRRAFEERLSEPLPSRIVDLIARLREKESHGRGASGGISSPDRTSQPGAPPPSSGDES